jgi:DNA helicase-2/ATP-dependent DNA helicase PcrA
MASRAENILDELNPEQSRAVQHFEGPALVLAGAGSGKTRVITYRIAYLVGRHQVRPRHILAVTFTNKAAGEMKERAGKLVGEGGQSAHLSTFHSLGASILRQEAERLGFRPDFSIYDNHDSLRVIKECIKELYGDKQKDEPRAYANAMDGAKNENMPPEEYRRLANDYFTKRMAGVYQRYQEKLRANNAFDFGDLVMMTATLFRDNREVLTAYRDRFRYILIDEYQDINQAQYQMMRLLCGETGNIYVVGDPDQSIYAWRGADVRNILGFQGDFKGAEVYRLESNYRSSGSILSVANHLIKGNKDRFEKKLIAMREPGPSVRLAALSDEKQEADYIARRILFLRRKEKLKNRDFVVLYRTNAQSRIMEDTFRWHNLPYEMVGGTKFYDRSEIKDVLAYLMFLVNPDDSLSLRRIINVPSRGIGDTSLDKMVQWGAERQMNLARAINEVEQMSGLAAKTRAKVRIFLTMLDGLRDELPKSDACQMLKLVIEKCGYLDRLKIEGSEESMERLENVKELVSAAQDFVKKDETGKTGKFLERVSLIADVDQWDDVSSKVTMMTMHNAKGLEFPVVFLSGLEENLMPHANSLETKAEIEEERRLMYVGLTRGMEMVFLTHAWRRMVFGRERYGFPSRFIKEIPKDMIELEEAPVAGAWSPPIEGDGPKQSTGSVRKRASYDHQTPRVIRDSAAPKTSGGLRVGDGVEHGKFGPGTVLSFKGSGEKRMLVVSFMDYGQKTLLASLAKLKKK